MMRRILGIAFVILPLVCGSSLAKEGEKAFTPQTFMVPMRDGIKLAADVYLPDDHPGPFPVILTRTPYNKARVANTVVSFVKYGYAVVIQDVRGRFASEGKAIAFFHDDEDGYDTVEWIVKQPWSNGRIGTFGGSAMGVTQNMISVLPPPHLTCQAVVMAPSSLYDTAYTGGGFRLALVAGWLGSTGWPLENLDLILKHSFDDPFWDRGNFTNYAKNVHIPVLHAGGWYDVFAEGALNTFNAYQNHGSEGAKGRQKVIMGPWVHGSFTPKAGDFHFPDNAAVRLMPGEGGKVDIVRWFDWCLKGRDTGVEKEPAVQYYLMGALGEEGAPGNIWRTSEVWPPPHKKVKFYFYADGTLKQTKPKEKGSGKTSKIFTYDPHNPVPTICGHNLGRPRPGSCDQRPIESRSDVIVLTSDPLNEPLEITGHVTVELFASSSEEDTDFTAKLTDVYPDGRSMLIMDGLVRARRRNSPTKDELLTPGKVYGLTIDLGSTSLVFNKGHRIRLAISSSNYPKFDVNPNTGEQVTYSGPILKYLQEHAFTMDWKPSDIYPDVRVAQNTIYFDGEHPSSLLLPVTIQSQK